MGFLKKSETSFDRSTDPLWWALAVLLSLVSAWLPTLLRVKSDHTTPLLVTYLAMFFSGSLLGGLRPDRVWRWGVAAFLTLCISDLAKHASDPKFTWFTRDDFLAYVTANASGWAATSLPMFLGAYLGFYLVRSNIKFR
ncbi:MAG TPA: hypothetical protein PLP04_15750 [Bryobacteraceae bacterium]|nr:hypothetical protein [Bryobacteraceae bacterium]HPQ16686.1 hypothetical protein [Bryobacteraceae bacterium]